MTDGAKAKAWAKLKVTDLKAELKRRGLAQAGLKAELVARLEADEGEGEEVERTDREASSSQAGRGAEEEDDAEARQEQAGGGEMQNDGQREQVGGSRASSASGDKDEVAASREEEEDTTGAGQAVGDAEGLPLQDVVAPSDVEGSALQDVVAPSDMEGSALQDVAPSDAEAEENNGQSHYKDEQHDQSSKQAPQADAGAEWPSREAQTPRQPASQAEPSWAAGSIQGSAEAAKRKRRSASPAAAQEWVKRRRGEPAAASRGDAEAGFDDADAGFDDAHTGFDDADDAAPHQGREVAAALHEATAALYINNLMRPIKEADLKAHLAELADGGAIVDLYVDAIRTHAFVVLDSVAAASRIRAGLHDCVWPRESTRKPLRVDYVPVHKVPDWIDAEVAAARDKQRPGRRWHVVYHDGVAALHSSHAAAAPANPASTPVQGAPTGPRASGPLPARIPTGPRADRFSPPPPPPPAASDAALAFAPVSAQLAHQRLLEMRSFFSGDRARHHGRDINRYSFQDADKFVDRGREIFAGIRPPRRQLAMDRVRRNNAAQAPRPSFAPPPPPLPPTHPRHHDAFASSAAAMRADRYVPASRSPAWRRDEARPRY